MFQLLKYLISVVRIIICIKSFICFLYMQVLLDSISKIGPNMENLLIAVGILAFINGFIGLCSVRAK